MEKRVELNQLQLHIIDLDIVLHVGTKANHGKKFNVATFPTGGIYNLMSVIRKTNALTNPGRVKLLFVYDTQKNYRKEIFPAYKAHRKNKTKSELLRDKGVRLQKELMIEALSNAGFAVLGREGYEADDIMFNIGLHYAYHPEQPLSNGMNIILHSSDEDWIGTMGLAPNIYFECTVNQNRIKNVTTYNDFKNQTGENVEDCYISRALNGDNDGYGGFAKVFREMTGTPVHDIFSIPEVKENFMARFWDAGFFKGIFNQYFSEMPELLKLMELHTNLAFPMYMSEIYEHDITNLVSVTPNKEKLLELLNIVRVNTLKTQIGELDPYSSVHERQLRGLKEKYSGEYQDVFDFYKSIEFLPEVKITTDQVEIAFGLTK